MTTFNPDHHRAQVEQYSGWSLGEGMRCFFYDFVEGESLLGHMLPGEPWADEPYRGRRDETLSI